MKRALSLLALGAFLALQSATANVPARRPMRTFTQSDGTAVTVSLRGNGRYAYYVTADGLALLRGAGGDLCYTRLTGDGLAPTQAIAHEQAARSAAEARIVATAAKASDAATHLEKLYPADYVRSSRSAASTTDGLGRYGQSALGVVSSIGTPTIPVIMAEFSDKSFMATTTTEKLSRWLNEKGYADEPGCVGSVGDYFAAQSGGLFAPTFRVVAKVKLSKPYTYYGQDGSNGTTDVHKAEFVQEALDLAAAQGVDFTAYAKNGRIDNVSIFYAGPGQHSAYEEGWENYLWAHFSTRTFTTTDGVRVSSYFIGNELLQNYYNTDGKPEFSDPDQQYPIPQSAVMDGIGVFCHEFGHALGLPDFYYTGNNDEIADTLKTMWYWSVMDYGQYVADGYAPIGYNAYERSFMGWLDVADLKPANRLSLPALDAETTSPKAFCIRNASNTAEYYLLENRQPGTWYPQRMGSGLLITHVNYAAGAWSGNTVNNVPNAQRFSYIAADGEKENNRFRDLFPYGSNDSFTAFDNLLYDITVSDGLVTFSSADKSTGINSIQAGSAQTPRRVYRTDGRYVGTLSAGQTTDGLPAGIYIVTDGKQQEKIIR